MLHSFIKQWAQGGVAGFCTHFCAQLQRPTKDSALLDCQAQEFSCFNGYISHANGGAKHSSKHNFDCRLHGWLPCWRSGSCCGSLSLPIGLASEPDIGPDYGHLGRWVAAW